MPSKHEHIVKCQLSRRQRELYDEFMSRTKTRETIAAGTCLTSSSLEARTLRQGAHSKLFFVLHFFAQATT